MTDPEPTTSATQPPPDNLTARVFRALYQDFDLYIVAGTHIAVPKGTHCFAGSSLARSPARSAITSITPRCTCTKYHPPECS